MFILAQKLRNLKAAFKHWNKETFGDVHLKVKHALHDLDVIQKQIHYAGHSDELQVVEQQAQISLQQALSFEETFWKEKSRLRWFNEGDRNTSFFHKVTRLRNAAKQMSILKRGDTILDSPAEIEEHVLDFYSTLYASDNKCAPSYWIGKVIPSLVSPTNNAMLTNLPSPEEIRNAVFSMNGSGAPGPDGVGGSFYQAFWDVIGTDVFNSVYQYFCQSWLLPGMNSNLVTLIPKFPGADRIENYRPIALANF